MEEATPARSAAESREDMDTPDVHDAAIQIHRAKEAYMAYAGIEEQPTGREVVTWHLYELCTYFIHTVLIPIVFPLAISQIVSEPPEPPQGWTESYKGLYCTDREMKLYERLAHRLIRVNNLTFSSLGWTSVSWVAGLILMIPILGSISFHLDHGHNQQLIAAAATATGAFFCLLVGFFETTWVFVPYIAAVVVASAICTTFHSRNLGLMLRGFTGPSIRKSQFPSRRDAAGRLSLFATAAGCVGSTIIVSFTYHMLSHSEKFMSLWIVSIFSGLEWLVGVVHVFAANRPGLITSSSSDFSTISHIFSIFKFPHASGSLLGVFLSSFSTMCIFTGAILYLVGQFCLKPKSLLFLWLTYFIFPPFSLPLLQPLMQQIIKADAVKMQLLGFLLSTLTSGVGFYYRGENWKMGYLLIFIALQGTGAGLLYSFGRVLLLDCSPSGKEGAFSAWFSYVRMLGTCAGFAVASAIPGDVGKTYGIAFCAAVVGVIVLIFGNISNFGGAIAAGHVREPSEKGSLVKAFDDAAEVKEAKMQTGVVEEIKTEV